jgi:hypothetical protein
MDREPSGKNREVKVDASECGQTERDAKEIKPFHGESICAN